MPSPKIDFLWTIWRKIIGLIAVVILSACVTRPPANLTPLNERVQGSQVVSVMTVSTRALADNEAEIYSGERGDELSFRYIDVSIPPNHERGNLEWPTSSVPNPKKEFSVLKSEVGSEDTIPQWFEAQESNGRLFIFVHGYNMHYSEAVFRLSQIATDLGTGAAPVLFTWPSRGTFTSYLYDQSSAMYSRDALELLLEKAAQSNDVKEITILAHSMGAWLTMETLRQSAIRNGEVNSKITDVILASPDIDRYVFDTQMMSLGEERPHFTIVVSSDDKALKLSRLLSGGISRVGGTDFSKPENMKLIEGKTGVTVIDLSEIDVSGNTHHSKFADSDESLTVISKTLQDNQSSTREPSRHTRSVLIAITNAISK